MERKELLQLYYNEALEFVFNTKSINRQMIDKINKRFKMKISNLIFVSIKMIKQILVILWF